MKKIIGLCIVIFFSIAAMWPLFGRGYFPMHDDTQVARVIVMGKALRQGQFPVRMVSDLGYGYGYPIFNFYGPLPYYVGGGLYACGMDSVTATKLMFAIGMLIAPITMYFLVSLLFGGFAGVLGSLLFMYAPYHAVQVYVRGSVGEYWAIAFVPLLIFGFIKALREQDTKKGIIIGSLALSAVVASHTILGAITAGFVGISIIIYWGMLLIQKKLTQKSISVPVIIAILGLAISAFFWLPAMVELPYTSVRQMVNSASTTFFDHFVCPMQLFSSPWGFAGSAPGCVDGMSFKLGKLQIFFALFSLFLSFVFIRRQRMRQVNRFLWMFVGMTLVSTILTLDIAKPVWNVIPITSFIQYPWRLLSYSMLFLAACGAYVVYVSRVPVIRMMVAIGCCIVIVGTNMKIFRPQYMYQRESSAFERSEELRFTISRISDEYLPMGISKPSDRTQIASATVFQAGSKFFVKSLVESDTSLRAEVDSSVAQRLTVRKAWFPGWKMTVNGKSVTPENDHGFYTVNIEQGKSIIEMQFTNTQVRSIANLISILGCIAIGVLLHYGKKTNA